MFLKKWKLIGVMVMIVLLATALLAAATAATGDDDPLDSGVVFLPWVAAWDAVAVEAAGQCAIDKLNASAEHIACLAEATIFAAGEGVDPEPLIAACDATRDEAYAAAEALAASEGVACAPDWTKGMYHGAMRRSNIPPEAHIEVLDRPLPNRLQLSAKGSYDPDGWIHHYIFRVYDAETGELVAGPLDSPKPNVNIPVPSASPTQTLQVEVRVEDDTGHGDTAEALTGGPPPACFTNIYLTCMGGGGSQVVCTINDNINTNARLYTDEVLAAAQKCDSTINESTKLLITAWGGSGGTGGHAYPGVGGTGGEGGAARVGTTIAELWSLHIDDDGLCFGLGQFAWSTGDTGGAGGSATLLRGCGMASNTSTAGVILIAGGGGGGGPGTLVTAHDGGTGGIAISSTTGACPPDCLTGTTGIGDLDNYPLGPGSGAHGHSTADTEYWPFGGGGGVGYNKELCQNDVGNRADGHDGIGGRGGTSAWGTAEWNNVPYLGPLVDGAYGQGGEDKCSNGAGGGGYGGGSTGGDDFEGGGGGGSYAMKSSWDISGYAPPGTNNVGDGIIQFDFFPYIP